MEEIWKNVVGYEWLYMVSNLGRVKSINRLTMYREGRVGLTKEKILSQHSHYNGYLLVTLSKDGMRCKYLVHRLMALAFLPNPDNKPCINHINGVKADNRIENFEWCTQKENVRHYFKQRLAI